MITYIELWKAKQTWINLSKSQRGEYMGALGPAIQYLLDNGVKIVSWGSNDALTFNKIDYDYFAVWTFPTISSAKDFEQMVEGAGWYNYFDQVNTMGTAAGPQEVIEHMINL